MHRLHLHQLLRATVQEPNVRVRTHDLFRLEFKNQPKHTVSGGMLRTKVHSDGLDDLRLGRIGHLEGTRRMKTAEAKSHGALGSQTSSQKRKLSLHFILHVKKAKLITEEQDSKERKN
eukprot:RCo027053